MTQPMYPSKHPEDYAIDFAAHMQAMTAEGLHSKSDIAVQLSWRNAELRRMHAELERKSDAIQKLWEERDALRDELELQKALVAEAQAMTAKVCAENEELKAQESELYALYSGLVNRANAELRKENEALRADAERYRWLRATENANRDEWNLFGPYSAPGEIDAAIDAARKEGK